KQRSVRLRTRRHERMKSFAEAKLPGLNARREREVSPETPGQKALGHGHQQPSVRNIVQRLEPELLFARCAPDPRVGLARFVPVGLTRLGLRKRKPFAPLLEHPLKLGAQK